MEEASKDVLQRLELERSQQSGARWFFWIAALSLVNTLSSFTGNQFSFVIGLTTTQFVDGVAMVLAKHSGAAMIGQGIAFAINALISSVFIVFGLFAQKGQNWAFILGMICYAADGLLCTLAMDWLSLGFHGFALFCIWGGMQAGKKLDALRAAEMATAKA